MSPSAKKKQILISLLTLVSLTILVGIFYSPTWWVSLTAPNYPEEAFPDGVRIHFHMNGVFNGCEKVDNAEIHEEEALDCVHEMDTINHYVGMYPIAAGGVIEKAFSPFLMSFMGVMLIGFMCTKPKLRMAILSAGFGVIAVWMGMTYYTSNGLNYQNAGYIHGLIAALDQDTEAEQKEVSAAQALIDRLKASMADSATVSESEDSFDGDLKAQHLASLKATFEKNQERRPASERQEWDGSGSQMLSWHYEKNLSRYFNNPAEIKPMVATMTIFAHVVFWGLIAAMPLLIFGARKSSGFLYWLLILVPLALPLFFLIEYSAWLWWYGHSMNSMGAFSVKPFMPTVFGQGKVAQFATHSYPHIGFGLMLLGSVVLAAVALLRRKQLREMSE